MLYSRLTLYGVAAALLLGIGGYTGWKLRGPPPTPTTVEVDHREERVKEKIVTIEKRPDGTEIRREEERDRSSSESKTVAVPKKKHSVEAGPRFRYEDLIKGKAKPEVWEAGYYRRISQSDWHVGVRVASDKSVALAVRLEF